MMENHGPLLSEDWISDLFNSKTARDGQVIRRKLRDIARCAEPAAFLNEHNRRGLRAIENAGHLIIFCNQERIRRVV